jgi:hypothetical protein
VAQLTFYFDRNFGKRFPEALAHTKPPFAVEYHHSKSNNFPQNMRDDAWLEICEKSGWIAFSHDQKFHAIAAEAMAIKQHNVRCFYLPGASEPTWEKLLHFVRAYPRILAIAVFQTPPYLYRVTPKGSVLPVSLP